MDRSGSSREIELGVRKPNAEELARAREVAAKPDAAGLPPLAEYYAKSNIRLSEYPDTVRVQLQAIRLGRMAIVSIPCWP